MLIVGALLQPLNNYQKKRKPNPKKSPEFIVENDLLKATKEAADLNEDSDEELPPTETGKTN